ncbi:MAG TPA: TetR/AcrR family transcriptional regulator [Bauldia sp.]|nr:TetR/AcrR family transcriptional regulator [Bauldia sp.]
MPYSSEHKARTRTRIIESARRLFNRHGFSEVSIDDIMAEAGLTRGGFYKHFAAKEDLYQAAVLQFICAERPEPWQRQHIDPEERGERLARMIVDAYLSDEHFEDRDASCPMIALPSDVSRGNGMVKEAFRQVMEMMVGAFAGTLPEGELDGRERALALVAQVVGGMVLARALDDRALCDEVRAATRKQVYETAGWKSRRPKRATGSGAAEMSAGA